MKILVTGAKGFIGRNLVAELRNRGYQDIFVYDIGSTSEDLNEYCRHADFVYHLAGINRPKNNKEFMEGNLGFTSSLLGSLKEHNNPSTIVFSSSIQAALDNPYGESKKAGEDILFTYGREEGVKVLVFRLPNVFGKWCKPNYNSVIATFCHNIARDMPITINDPNVVMNLVYVDDVVDELINTLQGKGNTVDPFCRVPVVYSSTLGEIADLLHSFRSSRDDLSIPDFSDQFIKKLYSTYMSYLPEDKFDYKLKMNVDDRGSFTEFLKIPDRGQISINISRPGITKGNHWHHTKTEKFLVVQGRGVIRFRKIDSSEQIEYFVSGDELNVIDIPPGYTHNIENLGDTDMVTVMWVNECYDPDTPDTFPLEV